MKAEKAIPKRILNSAEKAGLSKPLWYVGPLLTDRPRRKTLADIVREAR